MPHLSPILFMLQQFPDSSQIQLIAVDELLDNDVARYLQQSEQTVSDDIVKRVCSYAHHAVK